MKKIVILIGIIILTQNLAYAIQTYSVNGKFGLKKSDTEIITKAIYEKLVRVGETGWIIQKKNKFGLINNEGICLIQPKYRNVDRFFGKYVKLGNEKDFGIYDEMGNIIIKPEYTSIEPLFGRMFLTCKDYKYGVSDEKGKVILDNVFEEIYMPSAELMRVKHDGKWYELEKIKSGELNLPDGVKKITINNQEIKVTEIITKPAVASGYSVVTFTDYVLKLFSSISPAYEDTIDELMFSKGAETVTVLVRFGWIPKFPFTYAKNYYQNVAAPNSGPLAQVKSELKSQLK